jgi:hypothetical protein
VVVSHYQNVGQNLYLLFAIESIENVANFRYLETTATNQNCIHEEIEDRLNTRNAATVLYSVFSSRLLSKHIKIKIYKTIILPVVWYGCQTWSLTLIEEHRLRAFKNKMLRRAYGSEREEGARDWRRLHNEELHNFNASPNIIRVIKSREIR